MQKPSIGWQSWSPPSPAWHKFPRWDYTPFPKSKIHLSLSKSTNVKQKIRYWCSWYAYGWKINDQKISQTVDKIRELNIPFTHVLIDDGWTIWGDWHTPNLKLFPNLTSTINKIKSSNIQAGLWFAPFLANKKSQLFKSHPEWFIKYKGKYVQGLKTIPIWESFLPQQYLLDFELSDVKKYTTDFIDLAINDWGINLLKLDFLYAPYFNPNHKSDLIPHKQVSWLLSYIKKNYPNVLTVASGSPFAPAIGLADIIRISKDTTLPPPTPNFLNKIIYKLRVKMLINKMKVADLPSNIGLDPDVRLFNLDSPSIQSAWETIPTNILGIGDNLTTLSLSKLNKIKLWLSR